MRQVRAAHKAVEPDAGFAGEMMEHQHASAEPIRAQFKGRAIGRERVEPAGPRLSGVVRNRVLRIVLAVIQDELKAPVAGERHRFGNIQIGEMGRAVTITYPLEVRCTDRAMLVRFRSCTWDRSTPAESSGL